MSAAPRICAIIVAYNPAAGALENTLERIRPQVDTIVIVNNGDSITGAVDGLAGQVALIQQPGNMGIAHAHNVGIEWARQHGTNFVLLLDQDSLPDADMVQRLLAPCSARRNKPLSSTGPQYIDPATGHRSFFVRFGLLKFRRVWCDDDRAEAPADFLISSGMLIPMKVLDDIGDMDESLFIDHVDTEWHLRANARGYRALGVCNALMHHTLGSDSVRIWLGRWRQLPKHAPERHYYSVRNSLLLYRRDYADKRWIWNDMQRLLVLVVFVLLSHDQKRRHLKMMWLGLKHGLRGISGKLAA